MSWHKICASETLPSVNDIKSDVPVIEIANTSDASTVEDSLNESDLPNEDPLAYLRGLDSGNLMRFSQQSAIQEMLENQLADVKPNLDLLPTFDQHDIGGYNFQLNICDQGKKNNLVYSEALNKIYIRMNDIFNIEASYVAKLPMQKLRIRMLLCFVKEVSEPVARCQNHIAVDTESNEHVRNSLLRCENPNAEYRGKVQGKSINDRHSIVVPMNTTQKPGPNNQLKQMIALKFTCQNSCIGRKETSIIFLLESMNGEILSQRVIDVKICSCPKRDKTVDERNLDPKRKLDDDAYPRKKKMMKYNAKTLNHIKDELTDSELDDNSNDSNSSNQHRHQPILQRTASGSYQLLIEIPTKEMAAKIIDYSVCTFGNEILKNPKCAERYKRTYRNLRKEYDDATK